MADSRLNAVMTWRDDLTDGLAVMRVSPDGWQLPAFEAGQFAVLGLPAEAQRLPGCPEEAPPAKAGSMIRRAYSIASASHHRHDLEFLVRLVRTGALTPRLWRLGVGDRLWLGPKITGMFTLDVIPPEANVVMIATGTGLAPYMSMVRTYLESHRDRKFLIVHGARVSADLSFRAELERLSLEFAHFAYLPLITEPAGEKTPWHGAVGLIEDLWRAGAVGSRWGLAPAPENTHVLLCGNPGMVESMASLLKEQGFAEHSKAQPGQIHAERYW